MTARRNVGTVLAAVVIALATLGAGSSSATRAEGADAPSSIAELQRSLRDGDTTCRAVTARSLARIREADPDVHAVVETNPDAIAIARRLDARQRAGRPLGSLHCVPLLVKANYQTADTLDTTAGSILMKGFEASEDAFVVRRLRQQGAVVLGKTNMDEWAHGTAGYSSLGGQTANGLRTTRGPSGSSGGSAAAVAQGMALVATGSDTGGSIQGPASWNGVVGLRPTVGLISRAGIIPFASFSDVPGPLVGSVADLARVLGTLTGVDPDDPDTRDSRGHFATDYTRFLDADGLRGARIGVLREMGGFELRGGNADVDAAFEDALATMREGGARMVDLPSLDVNEATLESLGQITSSQFHTELDEWFAGPGRDAPVHSLAEVVQASSQPGVREVVRVLSSLEQSLAVSVDAATFDAAVAQTDRVRDATLDLIRDHELDAIVYPTMMCPAAPLPGEVDPTWECTEDGVVFEPPLEYGQIPGALPTIISPITRLPALTVPGGALPGDQRLGINFLGRGFSEGELIRLASGFERAARRR